jgi:carboxylesterase type B
MVGSNDDEWRLFLVPGGLIDQIPMDAVVGTLAGYRLPVETTCRPTDRRIRGASPGELLATIQTDGFWRVPGIRLAEAHARNVGARPTYMYELGWRSPQCGGRLGACHTLEIPFVFDTLGRSTATLHGDHPPHHLARAMHAAWVAFATTGDPGWPRYDLARRATMRFDLESEVVDDPRAKERLLWEAAWYGDASWSLGHSPDGSRCPSGHTAAGLPIPTPHR